MPVTRSRTGKDDAARDSAQESAGISAQQRVGARDGSATTSTTETSGSTETSGTTTKTATTATEVTLGSEAIGDTAVRPAAVAAWSKANTKKRAVHKARLKLVELRSAELEIKAAAAKAARELAEAQLLLVEEDSSDEEDAEQEEMSSTRVASWLQQRQEPLQPKANTKAPEALEEDHGARADQAGNKPGRAMKEPPAQGSTVGVEALAAALSQIAARKEPPRYMQELPTFGGQVSGWLVYRAAYRDSEASFSRIENIMRIRRSLRGVAYESVSSLLISQPDPRAVMEALERRFGRPEALVIGEMEKLRALTKVSDNARDLCIFAGKVANIVATVEALGRKEYLQNPEMVRSILEKLTPILRNKWYDYSAIKAEGKPEMVRMATFLNEEADKCGAYALPEVAEEGQRAKKKVERTYAAVGTRKDDCQHCRKSHKLVDCPNFIDADVANRWAMVKKYGVCFLCLKEKHRRLRCQAKACAKEGCGKKHHTLLHSEPVQRQPEPEKRHAEISACATEKEDARPGRLRRAYLKIAPIELTGPRAKISTYALLDDGSTCTFVEESITELLGIDGPTDTLWVKDANGGEVKHENSKTVSLRIRGKNQRQEHILRNAQTVKRLDFTSQAITRHEIDDCPHLMDIAEDLIYTRAHPKVVIGQNNWNLIISREVREGRRDQPVASLTQLGWVLHGCRLEGRPQKSFCGYIGAAAHSDSFEEVMKDFFKLESLGIEPRKQASDPEQRALRILEEKSLRLPDGRFETGLLWRNDEVNLHNNYSDALKRLHSLERRLDRNADLKAKYKERVENLLTSGYAERAERPSTEGKTWYLPHFAVVSPTKPKIRMVHDAAAKSAGKSLNDMLLAGPDLLQSLPGVVMRFRQYAYAVSADIKEMFMQVRINPADRDALRFLWRDDRRGEDAPDEYRMTSVIFGASSSPCTALFIKNKNAQDHENEFPAATKAIIRNMYMDDYLSSFPTIQEAERVNREVGYVNRQAHFELRGWTSNEPRTIQSLTASEGDDTVSIGGSEVEKALGLYWDVRRDHISFRVNERKAPPSLMNGGKPPTKREALSVIMSLFDPLGLITPITTPAKRLMQDAWKFGTKWDDPLPDALQQRWREWTETLQSLDKVRIPRCYESEPAATRQLHTFVDASEEAYAAAVYWRTTRADGGVSVALAAAKSRVTPLKPISIPRLELQAALLGARLADTVAREHEFEAETKVYWSDSRTALAWIRAEPRTFKTFVAHRLAEIEDTTKKTEWRWLPSAENVADDATRSTPVNFETNHRWYTGPSFLRQGEEDWPKETPAPAESTGEEKEKCFATAATQVSTPGHLPDIYRFSRWLRLVRVTARVLQFVALCRAKRHETMAALRKRTKKNAESDPDWKGAKHQKKVSTVATRCQSETATTYVSLEAHYLIRAEQLWVLSSQRESFGEEIDRILADKGPTKGGKLAALSVAVGADQTLRLRGRIGETPDIVQETTCPIILDGKHAYTKLYIQHVHEKLHHGGTETVVNELRQRTWIIRIRPTVKSVIKQCMYCRLMKAKPGAPATGDLPGARLAHHERAFTHTGLDYFGPLEVTVGRDREKRYVALFTCMTSRAIHLEIVPSLSADAAINALRRFVARRGCPHELLSDNATCFKAADRELRAAALEGVADAVTNRLIQWRYIPPAAPFMGGAWERMVRSVKEALRTTLHERYPSDDTLATLLAEVEYSVNSRPLTHVAVTPEAPEALTPNHLLLGPNSSVPAPGAFTEKDEHARALWRRVQYLADEFWRRWLLEYLPLLQHRREPHTVGEAPRQGDLVLICDETQPRNTWPRAKVVALHPGRDGETRVVDVITGSGRVLRRPTKRIVVLPVESRDGGGADDGDGGRMCTTEPGEREIE